LSTERTDDRYGGRIPSNNNNKEQTKQKTNKNKTNKNKTENKSGNLKNNPVFDWQPLKCLEQWSNMLMSSLAKTTFAAWL